MNTTQNSNKQDIPFDKWSREYPAFRRLLDAANKAAASDNADAYRTAHAAVLAWRPPRRRNRLTAREKRVHAAFASKGDG